MLSQYIGQSITKPMHIMSVLRWLNRTEHDSAKVQADETKLENHVCTDFIRTF